MKIRIFALLLCLLLLFTSCSGGMDSDKSSQKAPSGKQTGENNNFNGSDDGPGTQNGPADLGGAFAPFKMGNYCETVP